MLGKTLLVYLFVGIALASAMQLPRTKSGGAPSKLKPASHLSGQGPPPSPACLPGGANWPCPSGQQGSSTPGGPSPSAGGASTPQPSSSNVDDEDSTFRQQKPGLCKLDRTMAAINIKFGSTKYGEVCRSKKGYDYVDREAKSANGALLPVQAGWSAGAYDGQCDHMLEAVYLKMRLLSHLAEHMRRNDPQRFPKTTDAEQVICEALRANVNEVRKIFNGKDNMFGVPKSVNQFKTRLLQDLAARVDLDWTLTATGKEVQWYNKNKSAQGILQYDDLHRSSFLAMADTMQGLFLRLLTTISRPYSVRAYAPDAWRDVANRDLTTIMTLLKRKRDDLENVLENNCDTNPNGSDELYPRDSATGCCSAKSLAAKEFKPSDEWFQAPDAAGSKRKCGGQPCDTSKQCCLKADGKTEKKDPEKDDLQPRHERRRHLLSRPALSGRQSIPGLETPGQSCEEEKPKDDGAKPDLPGPAPLAALPAGVSAAAVAVAAWLNPLWLAVAAAATAGEARKDHQKEVDDNLASFAALAADKDHQDECKLALGQLQRVLEQMRYEPSPPPSCGGDGATSAAPSPTLTPQEIYSMGVAAIKDDPLAATAGPVPTTSHPTPQEIYNMGVAAIQSRTQSSPPATFT